MYCYFKPYFFSNIETKYFTSDKLKQFVLIFIPLFSIHPPSSIIQIAKAIGDRYSSINFICVHRRDEGMLLPFLP
jgi:hypothetical protein